MPKYYVKVLEIHEATYVIENATDAEDAEERFDNGEAILEDDGTTFVEIQPDCERKVTLAD